MTAKCLSQKASMRIASAIATRTGLVDTRFIAGTLLAGHTDSTKTASRHGPRRDRKHTHAGPWRPSIENSTLALDKASDGCTVAKKRRNARTGKDWQARQRPVKRLEAPGTSARACCANCSRSSSVSRASAWFKAWAFACASSWSKQPALTIDEATALGGLAILSGVFELAAREQWMHN